jgi:hypothetical protein
MPKEKLPASVGRHTDLSQRFPQASTSFLRLNGFANIPPAPVHAEPLPADSDAPAPKSKRSARPRSLAASQAQEGDTRFRIVRVKSFRTRLLDTDNLVPKWHVDALRYAGILPSDAPDRARIETSQQKVKTKAEERTEIEILITP